MISLFDKTLLSILTARIFCLLTNDNQQLTFLDSTFNLTEDRIIRLWSEVVDMEKDPFKEYLRES